MKREVYSDVLNLPLHATFQGLYFICKPKFYARGGTPIHYLYGYVPSNGVVILKLPI